jgi:hypothetical protein
MQLFSDIKAIIKQFRLPEVKQPLQPVYLEANHLKKNEKKMEVT